MKVYNLIMNLIHYIYVGSLNNNYLEIETQKLMSFYMEELSFSSALYINYYGIKLEKVDTILCS